MSDFVVNIMRADGLGVLCFNMKTIFSGIPGIPIGMMLQVPLAASASAYAVMTKFSPI